MPEALLVAGGSEIFGDLEETVAADQGEVGDFAVGQLTREIGGETGEGQRFAVVGVSLFLDELLTFEVSTDLAEQTDGLGEEPLDRRQELGVEDEVARIHR